MTTVDNSENRMKQLMEEVENKRKEKDRLLMDMMKLDNKINELEEVIYSICEHVWVIDRSFYSEHTEWVCKKCNQYKY